MLADDHLSAETAALLARADKAIRESRRLKVVIKGQRDRALDQLDRMFAIGVRMRRPFTARRPPYRG